jgi:hypothetical protein
MKNALLSALLLLAAPLAFAAAPSARPDAEGFIRDWLVLGPHSISGGAGADEIDRKQFPEEAQPAAKEGASQAVSGKALVWRKVKTSDFLIDFKELYPAQSEYVAAWAVAYVVAPADKTGLTLKMNSNDQGKVYLNGKEVVKFTDTRTLEKGAEDPAVNVTLKKGVNVVVLKVINEENNWQGSLRFVDAAGKPVTDLTIENAR